MNRVFQFSRRCGRACALLLLFGLAVGCGTQTYEARLAETQRYHQYLDKLKANLASQDWSGSGVTLRVPKAFNEIAAPPPETDEEGNLVPPASDPRQPEFVDGGLPGLVGAWRARVTANNRRGEAWLFLLSNYPMWLDEDSPDDPTEFHGLAVQQLSRGLEVRAPRDEQWLRETLPSGPGYVRRKGYTLAALNPEREIGDHRCEVKMYLHQAGDMQVMLVSVIPQGMQPAFGGEPSLEEQIRLTLETMNVSSQKPTRAADPAAAGGSPF